MRDAPVPNPRSPGARSRRQVLGLLGAGAAALGLPRTPAARADDQQPASGPALDCVVTPEQTEGPYFVDERLRRQDLRPDPTTGHVAPGSPLRLRVEVARVDGATCAPLPGAVVDVWQCDALGVYSDVRDFGGRFDTRGRKFLRGYQLTDERGRAEFLTIYPGWYEGRAVHIHFKVRLVEGGRTRHELTSQLYFDDAVTDRVHALPPYSRRGRRTTRNDADRIFRSRDSGSRLVLRLQTASEGHLGSIGIGLRMG